MEPVRNDTTTDRRTAVELAKRLLVDLIWRTAKIEVDGVTFPDTQEIFDGRAPEGMSVDDIVTVNNIKRAWRFLLDNIDYPVDWQYIREYNRIIGEGRVRDAGRLREYWRSQKGRTLRCCCSARSRGDNGFRTATSAPR